MCHLKVYDQTNIPAKVRALLIAQLKETCRREIPTAYGNEVVDAADLFVVSTRSAGTLRSRTTRTQFCGFAAVQEKEDHLYVQLLCANNSPGTGRAVLEKVEELGKERGKNLIKLKALGAVIGFYRKLGYTERSNACNTTRAEGRVGDKTSGFRMSKCLHDGAAAAAAGATVKSYGAAARRTRGGSGARASPSTARSPVTRSRSRATLRSRRGGVVRSTNAGVGRAAPARTPPSRSFRTTRSSRIQNPQTRSATRRRPRT